MTEQIAKNILSYACESGSPETHIEEHYLKHKEEGKYYWEYMLKMSNEMTYSTRNSHLKDRLKNYCATRLQGVSNKEELEKQIQQKDSDIIELTRANLKLQNEYLPHAIKQTSSWKRYYWVGIIATAIGTLGGASLGLIPSKNQEQPQVQDVLLIHDTIYLTKYDTIYISK